MIQVDGINDEALVDEGTDARSILTDEGGNNPDFDGDGRVFELETLSISNEHASDDGVVEIWDADEGSSPAAAVQKLTVQVAAGDTTQITWPPGTGPRFVTGIVASLDADTGTVNAGGVHASGVLH